MGYPAILFKFGVQIEGFIVGAGGADGGVVCVCVCVCVAGGWRGRLPCGGPS